jgi:transcriptional regulator with XRE-family HTH domain
MDVRRQDSESPRRFCQVNAAVLRTVRLQTGLSQAELARRSGYSTRLIRKAESGGTLNYETIADIAMALTDLGSTVQVEELIFDPLAIVKEFVEGYLKTGVDSLSPMRPFLADHIALYCSADPVRFPLAGTWSGVGQVLKFFTHFCERYQRSSGNVTVSYLSGADCVAARFEDSLVFEGVDLPLVRFNWHFQFQAGTIVRIDFELDHLAISQWPSHRMTNKDGR